MTEPGGAPEEVDEYICLHCRQAVVLQDGHWLDLEQTIEPLAACASNFNNGDGEHEPVRYSRAEGMFHVEPDSRMTHPQAG